MSLAATGIVREQLDPQLAMNKPKWISDIYLHNFSLGDEPPAISGVKVKPIPALVATTEHTLEKLENSDVW